MIPTYQRPNLADIAGPTQPKPYACRAVMDVLRAHGRPMSFSLIASRVLPAMPYALIAAALLDLLHEQEEISLDEHYLYEAER